MNYLHIMLTLADRVVIFLWCQWACDWNMHIEFLVAYSYPMALETMLLHTFLSAIMHSTKQWKNIFCIRFLWKMFSLLNHPCLCPLLSHCGVLWKFEIIFTCVPLHTSMLINTGPCLQVLWCA